MDHFFSLFSPNWILIPKLFVHTTVILTLATLFYYHLLYFYQQSFAHIVPVFNPIRIVDNVINN